MCSSTLSSAVLHSKFRGSLIGALLGDCLGAPFETDVRISKRVLNNYLKNLMSGESRQILPYTDDTSMTLSVASSLVENGDVNPNDMAKKFVEDYYSQPKRGYGRVVDVFKALRETNFEDIFLPAKLQFNGSGSYGNGAAMRIAPIALFGHNRGENYIMEAAEKCSRITHAHENGINGAILQSLAVNAALGLDSSQSLDPIKFIDNLHEKMLNIENKSFLQKKPFCTGLEKIHDIYAQNQEDISSEEIAEYLGNDVSALQSVPTAIYSFLRGMKPFKDYESSNPFLRTIYFAISVGGDTDTIASMAGSIAGAYYGIDMIPEVLQKRCEIVDEVHRLADKLFEATQEKE